MILKSFLILNSSLENDNILRKKCFFDVFILINILHPIAFPPKKKRKITMTYTAVTVRVIKINVT